MYTCPFCKTEIEDGIDALNEHREPGGDCDRAMNGPASDGWTGQGLYLGPTGGSL